MHHQLGSCACNNVGGQSVLGHQLGNGCRCPLLPVLGPLVGECCRWDSCLALLDLLAQLDHVPVLVTWVDLAPRRPMGDALKAPFNNSPYFGNQLPPNRRMYRPTIMSSGTRTCPPIVAWFLHQLAPRALVEAGSQQPRAAHYRRRH